MRRQLVDPAHSLSVRQQCRLLGISRGSVYYEARGEKPENLAIMR